MLGDKKNVCVIWIYTSIIMEIHVDTSRIMHKHRFILGIKERMCEFWVCPTGELFRGEGYPLLDRFFGPVYDLE